MPDSDPVAVFQLRDDEEFDLVFKALDRAGNLTTLDPAAVITAATSDPALLAVVQNDPTFFTVSPVGPLGTAQVSVKATLNGVDLTGSLSVEIVAGAADHLSLIPSTTRPKA